MSIATKAKTDRLISTYKKGLGAAPGALLSGFFSKADLETLLAATNDGVRIHLGEKDGVITLVARPEQAPKAKKALAAAVATAQIAVISIDCPPICGGKPTGD